MENKKETVCAVVVTYNRKKLLLECLEAIRKQTRPVQGIYLIDNASTDGTPKLLLEKGYIKELPPENLIEPWEKEFEIKNLTDGETIKLHYVRMHENTGGAGGFHEGVKRAYEKGYDWLWLMDDDAEPLKDSLYFLLKNTNFIENIGFLCSTVLFTNNQLHPANIPKIKKKEITPFLLKECLIPVESCSFVSFVISRKIIKVVGFPLKEFFIWLNDVEYSLRISYKYKYKGFWCLPSIVIHKAYTKRKKLPPKKMYFRLRNRIISLFLDSIPIRKKIASLKVIFVSFLFLITQREYFIAFKAIKDSFLIWNKLKKIR